MERKQLYTAPYIEMIDMDTNGSVALTISDQQDPSVAVYTPTPPPLPGVRRGLAADPGDDLWDLDMK